MGKRYKKSITILIIVILLVTGVSFYFRELSLSNLLFDDNTGLTILEEAISYQKLFDDDDITEQKQKEILQLFDRYSYRRKINTTFSDGAFSGNRIETYLNLHIYDGENVKNVVTLTDCGEITINYKNYKMKNADELIHEILSILER